jgi:hypothetical protein
VSADGDVAAAPQEGLTAAQLEDLASVVETLGGDRILWLVKSILGEEAVLDAADDVQDPKALATKMVAALRKAGRVPEVIALLRRDAVPHGQLAMDLEYILRGGRLSDGAARQKFTNEVEPFLNSAQFQERHPRFLRTVCAIALGTPWNEIRGSGFLIGPDLVMTNAHVIEPFLQTKNGEVTEADGVSGSQIFCFFDYHSDPAPRIPVQNGNHSYVTVTARKENWLYHAREPLPGEGTDQCPKVAGDRFDYAVIVLAQKVGNLPARSGGGPPRGWLTLPEKVDVDTPHRRVILYQHPGRAPQQFDIGAYVARDDTGTRVRYTVSTARGSSGGAAVDSAGELFALHSAAVETIKENKVNQGVQIDLIAKDLLGKKPELKALPPPDERPFWSLSDNAADPKAIIGRNEFRENVLDMHRNPNPATPRVMAVWGPTGAGLKFSMDLLRRTLGLDVRVATFGAEVLSTATPQSFLSALATSLGFRLFQPSEIPEANASADLPRWLDGDLPRWLATRLEAEANRDSSRYPAWVVLHTAVENFQWPYLMPELLAALAGAHDPGKDPVPMPHLRFLFLAAKADALPSMPGVERVNEDLTSYTTHAQDFVDCLDRALYAIDKHSDIGDPANWLMVAEDWVGELEATRRRKFLSDKVRRFVLQRLKEKQG